MKKTLIIVLGATVGVCGSIALRHILKKSPTIENGHDDPAAKQKRDEENRRQIAWRIVAPRIEIAQEEATKAVEARSQQVLAFFADRQKRIPAYADRVFSVRSKWELGKSKLPWTEADGHKRFLRDEFSKLVFSQEELKQQITGAVEDCARDIHAIENALLVKIRTELSDMPECAAALPDLKTEVLFRDRFEKVAEGLSKAAGADAKMDLGRTLASEIATVIAIRVGKAVGVRLGISAGIMATSEAAAPETLGVSIVVGLIVDQITGWIIGWFHDPQEEIRKKLNEEIGKLAAMVVNGDDKTRGLKQELTALSEKRQSVREEGLRKMILQALP